MPEAATYSVGSRLSFQDCFRLFPLFNSRLLAALFGVSTSPVCHLLKVGNGSFNNNGVFFLSLPLRRKANSIHSLEPATISLGKASSNVQSCTARSKVWPVFEHCFPNAHTRPDIQCSCTQRPVSESRLLLSSQRAECMLVVAPYSAGSRLSSPRLLLTFPSLILALAALLG